MQVRQHYKVWSKARRVFDIEANAATDNPMVFADSREVVSGGNVNVHALGETETVANSTVKVYRDGLASVGLAE